MNDYGLLPEDPIPPPVTRFFGGYFVDTRGQKVAVRLDVPYITRCQVDDDTGECKWLRCPQRRDNEPHTSDRGCPLFCGLEAEE